MTATARPPPANRDGNRSWSRTIPASIILAFAVAITVTTFVAFRIQYATIIDNTQREIESIAFLKVRQFDLWLNERRADITFTGRNVLFAEAVERWLKSGAREGRVADSLRATLDDMRVVDEYDSIVLFDLHGAQKLSIGTDVKVGEEDREQVAETIRRESVTLSDLHFAGDENSSHMVMEFFGPVYVREAGVLRPVAVIAFRINATEIINPMLQTWPVPTESGEVVLVRREGDEVVVLNDLRHYRSAPIKLRFPASQYNLPAAMAMRQDTGVVKGIDYRGTPVLASFEAVPGTPWHLVAKLDADEAYAPVRGVAINLSVIAALAFLAASGITIFWWRLHLAHELARDVAQQTERRALVAHFDYLAKYANDMIVLARDTGEIIDVNDRVLSVSGYSREELLRMRGRDLIDQESRETIVRNLGGVGQDGVVFETTGIRKNGSKVPLEVSARSIEVDGKRYLQGIIRDITERKAAEEHLRSLNLLYSTLNGSNEAMVRAGTRRELCERICGVVAQQGGWRGAWIGFVDPATRRIVPEAWSESMAPFIENMVVSVDPEIPQGRGPTSIAARTGKPYFCNDVYADPVTAPWRGFVDKMGIGSAAAVPLRVDNEFTGVINLYAGQTNFYSPEVQALLIQLGDDTSYALDAFDREQRRRRAEDALLQSEAKFRGMAEQSLVGISIVGPGGFLYVNSRFAKMFGYTVDEVKKMMPQDFVAEQDRARVLETMRNRMAGEIQYANFIFHGVRKDGTIIDVEVHGSRMEVDGKGASIAVMLDISDRKRAEETIRRANRALKALSNCNMALVHASSEEWLLNEICRVVVYVAGYRLAWVGFAEHDPQKTVRPVAHAGYSEGYMERANITWADTTSGQGPAGAAIRTQKPQIVQDARTDPQYELWRDNAVRIGYGSVLALPLVSAGTVLGALCIYAAEHNGFDVEEIRLLSELVDDLAFGIITLRVRAEYRTSAERLRRSMEATIEAIAGTVEMRDAYTGGHQRRVAELAMAIAGEMGMTEDEIHGIHLAGVVHDLGKIQVPAEILSKPAKLTKIEYELIKVHSQAGYEILKGIEFPWPIAQLVYQHHERLDGSGYPRGLKGEEILIGAKILAVADTIEAMSSHRPYRAGLGIDAALAEITKNSGKLFDAAAVDACVKLFREKRFAFST